MPENIKNSAVGLDAIFRPKSIAVIGATERKGSIGREITHNLIRGEFNGAVYPVNPRAEFIHSIKSHPTISDIADPVDLAVIIVRQDLVLNTVEECGKKGVKGVVVITAGFREVGDEGLALENKVLERVRHYNMRMVGPNCFGVINTNPDVMLNATFSRTQPLRGRIGFMSQSGALGEAILNHAKKLGIGFSMFASVGNKADISGNAVMQYWRDDPDTQIILLYLESFGTVSKFVEIAKTVTPIKPIIAVKAGKTGAGATATVSHTGALAGLDVGVDAMFEQCGVMRVSTIEELFEMAKALDGQPLPTGPRVAVLTNAGGPAILATDAVAGLGLEITPLEDKTVEKLTANLPGPAAKRNPVDMLASATADDYEMGLTALFEDQNVESIICIFVPPIMVDQVEVANRIVAVRQKFDKPMLACFMDAAEGFPGSDILKQHGIPNFTFPEQTARALEQMWRRRQWCNRPAPEFPVASFDQKTVERLIADARAKGANTVLGEPALEILEAYQIPIAHYGTATDVDEARTVARTIGYPVVLKLVADDLVHKTDIGGVIVDIRNDDEAASNFEILMLRAAHHNLTNPSVAIQSMVTSGVQMVLGMSRDVQFGPILMCGLGGVYVEVMKDVAFKLPPLSKTDAHDMIDSLRAKKLLTGFRGSEPVDLDALVDALLSLSRLVTDFPEIGQLDVNPFVVTPGHGESRAVDARIVLTETSR